MEPGVWSWGEGLLGLEAGACGSLGEGNWLHLGRRGEERQPQV